MPCLYPVLFTISEDVILLTGGTEKIMWLWHWTVDFTHSYIVVFHIFPTSVLFWWRLFSLKNKLFHNQTLHQCQNKGHKFRLTTDEVLNCSGFVMLEADVPFTAYIHTVASSHCNWRKNKASLAFCSVHCGEFDENVTLKMHVPRTFFGLCL